MYLLLACLGAFFSFLLTPVACSIAEWSGFLDQPNGTHKRHRSAVPLGGGAVVLSSLAATLATVFYCGGTTAADLLAEQAMRLPVLFSLLVIVVIGLTDDCYQISSRVKLLGQFFAALLAVAVFPIPDAIRIGGIDIQLGLLAGPFAIVWLVGASNAINLTDGVDGFASVISAGMGLTLAATAALLGHPAIALMCLLMVGAITGFVWFNLPPARIFLGDTGSLLVGWVLGLATLRGTQVGDSTMLFVPALVVWTIPLFDSLMAILRRMTRGTSVWLGDRQHLHHCLVIRLGCPWRVLRWAGYASLAIGLATILSVHVSCEIVALGAAAALVGAAIASRTFGDSELCQLTDLIRRCANRKSTPACPHETPDEWSLDSQSVPSQLTACNAPKFKRSPEHSAIIVQWGKRVADTSFASPRTRTGFARNRLPPQGELPHA